MMGRGLLDVWNEEYTKKFGSNIGTAGWHEAKRRDARTNASRVPVIEVDPESVPTDCILRSDFQPEGVPAKTVVVQL